MFWLRKFWYFSLDGSESKRDREGLFGDFFFKILIYVNKKMEGGKINNMNS
jgi:hypothetical protein